MRMKKNVAWMSMLLVFTLVVQMFVAPMAFAAETTGADYEKKSVPTYIRSMDNKTTTDCLFYKDLKDVVYIDPADYIRPLFTDGIEIAETKNSDGTYTITKGDTHMIVDPAKDTVSFDCYENFVQYKAYEPGGQTDGVSYVRQEPEKLQDNPAQAKLELAPYQIDIREADGKVYLPLPTLADIMSATYNIAQYYNGNLYYEYLMNTPFYDKSAHFDETDRNRSLIEYTYHELCFAVDHFYGRPQRCAVASLIEKNGLDKTLSTYSEDSKKAKEYLLSDKWMDYYGGMGTLQKMFEDGGHSFFLLDPLYIAAASYPDSLLSKITNTYVSSMEAINAATGSAVAYIDGVVSKIRGDAKATAEVASARTENLPRYNTVKTWENQNQLVREGDTVLFIFDSFEDGVVPNFKWALDYAKENGIKNFIIDLAQNGGGFEGVLYYMMAMLTNKKNHSSAYEKKSLCTLTGNYSYSSATADLNLDGTYDDADKDVYYDFNYAILTSRNSFSCGNLLPVLAQEEGIAILGETSGGGECQIGRGVTPENGMYQYSGCKKFVTQKGVGVDIGAKPDYVLTKTVTDAATGTETTDYSGFYDLRDIAKKVESFYEKKAANPMKVTVKATTVKAKVLKAGKKTIRPISIKNAEGKVSVTLVKKGTSAKIFKKLKMNKKGAITLKKGKYKKGTYKIAVKISAAGNDRYKAASVTKTVKVKVR